jgi:alanyl-tRNA synthetase
MEKAGGFAAVFCGSNEDGWRYIIGSKRLDLRAMSREINAAIQGRGGGTPQMIQGSARADRAEIEARLRALKA